MSVGLPARQPKFVEKIAALLEATSYGSGDACVRMRMKRAGPRLATTRRKPQKRPSSSCVIGAMNKMLRPNETSSRTWFNKQEY